MHKPFKSILQSPRDSASTPCRARGCFVVDKPKKSHWAIKSASARRAAHRRGAGVAQKTGIQEKKSPAISWHNRAARRRGEKPGTASRVHTYQPSPRAGPRPDRRRPRPSARARPRRRPGSRRRRRRPTWSRARRRRASEAPLPRGHVLLRGVARMCLFFPSPLPSSKTPSF